MWRPRTPVLELFPCSQNPAAVFLLAHWYGIAWLWSILFFFFTNFTSAAALSGLWAPTVVPSFRVYLSWRCWSKTGLHVKLDMCSCCAQVLLNSPLFKVLLLMSSEQKREVSALSQYSVTSSNPLGGQSLPCSLGPVLLSISQPSNFWGPLLDGFLPGSRCEDRILGARTYGRLFKKHKGLQSRF